MERNPLAQFEAHSDVVYSLPGNGQRGLNFAIRIKADKPIEDLLAYGMSFLGKLPLRVHRSGVRYVVRNDKIPGGRRRNRHDGSQRYKSRYKVFHGFLPTIIFDGWTDPGQTSDSHIFLNPASFSQ